jgi:hypothetical protein
VDTLISYILPIILSTLLGMSAFIMKSVFTRLDTLEQKINQAVTEEDVRSLLVDKIDPIKEDIHEIKQAIMKLYDLYFNERK